MMFAEFRQGNFDIINGEAPSFAGDGQKFPCA